MHYLSTIYYWSIYEEYDIKQTMIINVPSSYSHEHEIIETIYQPLQCIKIIIHHQWLKIPCHWLHELSRSKNGIKVYKSDKKFLTYLCKGDVTKHHFWLDRMM